MKITGAPALAITLKIKLFDSLSWTDLFIPASILTINQFAIYTDSVNPSHGAIPLFLILAYLNCFIAKNSFYRNIGILIFNFLLIFTGFGFFMGLITPVVFLIDLFQAIQMKMSRQRNYSACSLVIALISFALFFLGYTPTTAVACFQFPYPKFWEYGLFVSFMFGRYFSFRKASVLTVSQSFILTGLVLYAFSDTLIRIRTSIEKVSQPIADRLQQQVTQKHLVIAILMGFSLLFSTNTAIGRVCLGVGAGKASRYVPYMTPAFLALYFWMSEKAKKHDLWKYALIALIFLGLVGAFRVDPVDLAAAQEQRDGKEKWLACVIHVKDFSKCTTDTGFINYPDPRRPDIVWKLQYLQSHQLNLFSHHN